MTGDLTNMMRREAERAGSRRASVRLGIVSGYDPDRYAAKVRIQPEDAETGWLPIATPFAGNGWGLAFGLTPGEVVEVHFQEGGKEAGFVGLRHYGDRFRPPAVPSGEAWLVHKSGSMMKFHEDGSVELHAATAIHSSAPIWNHAGDVVVDGNIVATGDIYDQGGDHGNIGHFRDVYDGHTHSGVDPGGGTTQIPNQQV